MDREISFAIIGGVGFLKNNGYEKMTISSTYGDVECFIGKTRGINLPSYPDIRYQGRISLLTGSTIMP